MLTKPDGCGPKFSPMWNWLTLACVSIWLWTMFYGDQELAKMFGVWASVCVGLFAIEELVKAKR